MRSGVNCTRAKRSPVTAANERAIKVLARPGLSSISTCPSASSPSRTSSRASRLPMTARSTSSRMRAARSLTFTATPGGRARLRARPVRSRRRGRPPAPDGRSARAPTAAGRGGRGRRRGAARAGPALPRRSPPAAAAAACAPQGRFRRPARRSAQFASAGWARSGRRRPRWRRRLPSCGQPSRESGDGDHRRDRADGDEHGLERHFETLSDADMLVAAMSASGPRIAVAVIVLTTLIGIVALAGDEPLRRGGSPAPYSPTRADLREIGVITDDFPVPGALPPDVFPAEAWGISPPGPPSWLPWALVALALPWAGVRLAREPVTWRIGRPRLPRRAAADGPAEDDALVAQQALDAALAPLHEPADPRAAVIEAYARLEQVLAER